MRINLTTYLLFILYIIFFNSCKEPLIVENETQENFQGLTLNHIEVLLCEAGFDPTNALIIDDHVIVEKDIVLNIKELITCNPTGTYRNFVQSSSNNGDPLQFEIPTWYKMGTLKYGIHSELYSFGIDWPNIIHDGILIWNGINFSKVHFEFIDIYNPKSSHEQLDLMFHADEMLEIACLNNLSWCGGASLFPHHGAIGSMISINADCLENDDAPFEKLEGMIIHEIGHAIGFLHTPVATAGSEAGETCNGNWVRQYVEETQVQNSESIMIPIAAELPMTDDDIYSIIAMFPTSYENSNFTAYYYEGYDDDGNSFEAMAYSLESEIPLYKIRVLCKNSDGDNVDGTGYTWYREEYVDLGDDRSGAYNPPIEAGCFTCFATLSNVKGDYSITIESNEVCAN